MNDQTEETLPITRSMLRMAVAEQFYPAIPARDQKGNERIDRSVERLLRRMGIGDDATTTEDVLAD